jgi:hypothetical protein
MNGKLLIKILVVLLVLALIAALVLLMIPKKKHIPTYGKPHYGGMKDGVYLLQGNTFGKSSRIYVQKIDEEHYKINGQGLHSKLDTEVIFSIVDYSSDIPFDYYVNKQDNIQVEYAVHTGSKNSASPLLYNIHMLKFKLNNLEQGPFMLYSLIK